MGFIQLALLLPFAQDATHLWPGATWNNFFFLLPAQYFVPTKGRPLGDTRCIGPGVSQVSQWSRCPLTLRFLLCRPMAVEEFKIYRIPEHCQDSEPMRLHRRNPSMAEVCAESKLARLTYLGGLAIFAISFMGYSWRATRYWPCGPFAFLFLLLPPVIHKMPQYRAPPP